MKSHQIGFAYFFCIVILAGFTTCSKSSKSVNEQFVEGIDPALVGTWVGLTIGVFGEAEMTMVLTSDGYLTIEGSVDLSCPMDAKWEVISNEFHANGMDRCNGTSISFYAPYSKVKLVGTWSDGTGNKGIFSAEKQ